MVIFDRSRNQIKTFNFFKINSFYCNCTQSLHYLSREDQLNFSTAKLHVSKIVHRYSSISSRFLKSSQKKISNVYIMNIPGRLFQSNIGLLWLAFLEKVLFWVSKTKNEKMIFGKYTLYFKVTKIIQSLRWFTVSPFCVNILLKTLSSVAVIKKNGFCSTDMNQGYIQSEEKLWRRKDRSRAAKSIIKKVVLQKCSAKRAQQLAW